MRGSAPARIDDKGRLKIPGLFRPDIQERHGPDVFVTSLTGECVRIYPMPAWLDLERKLSAMPSELLRPDERARWAGAGRHPD